MSLVGNSSAQSIAVIGAGITGLTAAYRLHQRGFRVQVFEQTACTGGSVQTISENGYLIEAGPNSLQYGAPELKQLVNDLGLESELVPANPLAKRRFLVRGGKFVPVPNSPGAFLRSPLFGARTKFSLLAELLTRPKIRTTDLSLAELIGSHFTQELVDYAVNPLIAGIYAGDPAKLSVKHAFPSVWAAERSHGSIIRGMMSAAKAKQVRGESGVAPIVSFRRGLQQLTDTLAAQLPPDAIRLGTTVSTLLPGPPHRLVWKNSTQTGTDEFDAVVLAIPAGALAQLTFGSLGERPLATLENIPHPPVSSVFLGYKRNQINHPLDGYGGLVPAVEKRDVLGILFSSTLFPDRAPEGHVGLTVFVGGMRQPAHARLTTPQLLERIARDLRELVGVQGDPAFVRHSYWPRAIPQYVLGYEQWKETMDTLERNHSRLFIGGNARDGVSLPDCVKSGLKLADKVSV